MTHANLLGLRVLVVEDDFMIAEDLSAELQGWGADVVGPVPTVERALALVRTRTPLDGAVLDVNLGGVSVYPVADALARRGVPMVFATGYDPTAIPQRFGRAATCVKPVRAAEIALALSRLAVA